MSRFSVSIVTLVLTALNVSLAAADWPQFRKDGRAAAEGKPPLKWSVAEGKWENIAWRATLPGKGPSSPIVVGDRVVVTAGAGINQERMYVLCFDLKSGEELWRREFWATGRTATHTSIGNAAPTPASDGSRIFAFFSSNDLACLDLDGNLLWYRGLAHDFPKAGNDIGMSSSPFVIDQTVVVQVENQGDSFATGLDVATGVSRWRKKRAPNGNWSSPVGSLVGPKKRPTVFLQSPSGLTAHDPKTGEELWKVATACDTISSPIATDDMLYFAASGLTALKLVGSAEPQEVWQSSQLSPASSSPVLYKGRIYSTNRSGVLACADASSGKAAWDQKLRLDGRFWATHAAVNDHLYCFNSDGKAMVVQLGDKQGKIVFKTEFPEGFQASPAVAGDAVVVRTDSHLWKIGE